MNTNSTLNQFINTNDIQSLSQLELQNRSRFNTFNITPDNVTANITKRLDLFHSIHSEFVTQCDRASISPHPSETLWHIWLPFAMQLAELRSQQNRSLIQGFLGGQGVGKTTLTAMLTLTLAQLGCQTIAFSLDDLYLTYQERSQLQQIDPRITHRGPPGTHDVTLGINLLQQAKHSDLPIAIPQFDKSAFQGNGDRIPSKLAAQADIVLFEGWFVGARPIDPIHFETAPAPILTDADRQFARDMNDRLQAYVPLWDELDRLTVLYVRDYSLSKQWRKQAEHKMIAQGKPGLSDEEIDRFVEYFWKALHPELFIRPIVEHPSWVNSVIEINADHQSIAIHAPGQAVR